MPSAVEFLDHFPTNVREEIRNYINDEVMIESRYLFTRREGRKQYSFCTHCKREHESTGMHYGGIERCPLCGTAAHIKASGRGRKTLIDNVYLLWYEKSVINPEAIIARGFYATRDYTGDYRRTETVIKHISSYVFEPGKGGKMMNRSYYGGDSRWVNRDSVYSEAKTSMSNTPSYYCKESIQTAVQGTPFQYCTWEHYDFDDRVKVFDLAAKYPCMEYLTKLGMGSMIESKLGGQSTYGAINWRGKSIEKVLRLTKAEFKEWVKQPFKGVLLSLYAYQQFKKLGLKLNYEQSHSISSIALKENLHKVKELIQYTPIEEIFKYILKQVNREKISHFSATTMLSDWKDYIGECLELGLDLRNESNLFPNNLHEAHQKTSSKIKFKKDEALNTKIMNRAKSLGKYRFEYNGLTLRPIATNAELFQEGKELQHCVGGYSQRYAEAKTDIFVIRKVEEPDKPFYTIEINNGKIQQCRGLKNCNMTPEVKTFVDRFVEKKLLTKKRSRVDVTGIRQEVAV
ncbi:PcfJ domain-containing protein [Paenibacillus crassostreae]|uniref:PcfJ-like protein n=1 Tax=Paenibacillus crassostreae TaxID=1763538 RepID=A0A167C6H1_9BACL|nr:PcfJ domain-containing protein [Paenibacillus crassostreae]AOZ91587.1 hypothetical protein LPB68_04730 [Paenibacillus crassostreae]OAB72839.1 hypothetical protein PNBC_15520 [Paenibacillus crassostreae]